MGSLLMNHNLCLQTGFAVVWMKPVPFPKHLMVRPLWKAWGDPMTSTWRSRITWLLIPLRKSKFCTLSSFSRSSPFSHTSLAGEVWHFCCEESPGHFRGGSLWYPTVLGPCVASFKIWTCEIDGEVGQPRTCQFSDTYPRTCWNLLC